MKIYEKPPTDSMLNDPCLDVIRESDLELKLKLLDFQLTYCFERKRLNTQIWNDDSIVAMRSVTKTAGAMLQRSVNIEILLYCFGLTDDSPTSSSITNCHRQCFDPNLNRGEFKKFYMPLYQDICDQAKVIKPLRKFILAHQDYDWLKGKLNSDDSHWKNQETDGSGQYRDLYNLMTLFSYYLNMCNVILGKKLKKYEQDDDPIDGTNELCKAINSYSTE